MRPFFPPLQTHFKEKLTNTHDEARAGVKLKCKSELPWRAEVRDRAKKKKPIISYLSFTTSSEPPLLTMRFSTSRCYKPYFGNNFQIDLYLKHYRRSLHRERYDGKGVGFDGKEKQQKGKSRSRQFLIMTSLKRQTKSTLRCLSKRKQI